MELDRITHCVERLERDMALANRLKILELKLRGVGMKTRDLAEIEQEQNKIDADRTGRYVDRNSAPWTA